MSYYVKNSELLKEIILSKEKNELTPRAIEMFIKIANEASRKLKYRDPMDREDCIASALEDLLKYWRRFDPNKSNNAFAYFTQITKNGFAKGWKKLWNPESGQMLSLSQEGVYNI